MKRKLALTSIKETTAFQILEIQLQLKMNIQLDRGTNENEYSA